MDQPIPSGLSGLKRKVRVLRARKRAQIMFRALTEAIALGLAPVVPALVIEKLKTLGFDMVLYAAALGAIFALFHFVRRGLLVKIGVTECSLDADRAINLKDTLTSALLLERDADEDPMVAALVTDAEAKSARVTPRTVYPWRMPPKWRLSGATVMTAIVIFFVPFLGWLDNPAREAERNMVKEAGKRLIKLSKELKTDQKNIDLSEKLNLADKFQKLGEKFELGKVDKGKALEELGNLKDKLKTARDADSVKSEERFLSKLGSEVLKNNGSPSLAENMKNGKMSALSERLDSLKSKLEQGELSDAELGELEKLIDSIKSSLEASPDYSSKLDKEALKRALDKIAENLKKEKELRDKLEKTLDQLKEKVGALCDSLKKNGMGKEAGDLKKALDSMLDEYKKNGSISSKSIGDMKNLVQQANSSMQAGKSPMDAKQQVAGLSEEVLKLLGDCEKNQCDSGG